MRRTLVRLFRFAPALGIVAALAFPTTALASGSSIQVVSAHLIAKGVAVNLTISYTCPAGYVLPAGGFASGFSVQVQEAVSKTRQAFGSASTGGQSCGDGITPQTVVIPVLSSVTGPPFRTGPAVVIASILACPAEDPNCFTYSAATTGVIVVRISK